jgi:hypothetical protein
MQMHKLKLRAALMLFTIAGVSSVHAQTPPGPTAPIPGQAAPNAGPPAPTPEDLAAFSDARIAALKAGLKLSATQEKAWPAFETTVREIAKARADRIKKLDGERPDPAKPPDPIALLRLRIELLNTTAAELKRLADAAEPLFKSLDDAQKRRMVTLVGGRVPPR